MMRPPRQVSPPQPVPKRQHGKRTCGSRSMMLIQSEWDIGRSSFHPVARAPSRHPAHRYFRHSFPHDLHHRYPHRAPPTRRPGRYSFCRSHRHPLAREPHLLEVGSPRHRYHECHHWLGRLRRCHSGRRTDPPWCGRRAAGRPTRVPCRYDRLGRGRLCCAGRHVVLLQHDASGRAVVPRCCTEARRGGLLDCRREDLALPPSLGVAGYPPSPGHPCRRVGRPHHVPHHRFLGRGLDGGLIGGVEDGPGVAGVALAAAWLQATLAMRTKRNINTAHDPHACTLRSFKPQNRAYGFTRACLGVCTVYLSALDLCWGPPTPTNGRENDSWEVVESSPFAVCSAS
jgi:hypothetical protein